MSQAPLLSIIIPGYRDRYHERTVADILQNSELGEQLEIVSVFDGYCPEWPLIADERRRIIRLEQNCGMREAINVGVAASKGEYLMRLDEHCCVANGFDKELTASCQPNWIMTAKRYFLDPAKWEVMDTPAIEHEKLVIQNAGDYGRKFSAVRWKSRDKAQRDVAISETLAMQGSMWVMRRDWWDRHIGRLQTEGYGPLVQDSVEICMKTWQAGGKLMLNKNTWYAHKHRDFSRTHHHGTSDNPANEKSGFAYAINQWEPYYQTIKQTWGI